MHPDELDFDDLLEETHFGTAAELIRVIRKRGLPTVSSRRPISRKDANEIVFALTGGRIDWYKYRQRAHDIDYGGPFGPYRFELSDADINALLRRLHPIIDQPARPRIIGIVSEGGFLRGTDDELFSYDVRAGLNIAIGDRGSGKSTTAQLLALLSDSETERTRTLISSLLAMLSGAEAHETSRARKIRDTLRELGIARYACFFSDGISISAFYAETKRGYEFYRQQDTTWTATQETLGSCTLRDDQVLLLRQGEVFRIADEEQLALNNLLDRLYPALYKARMKLASQLQTNAVQTKELQLATLPLALDDFQLALRSASEDLAELETMKTALFIDAIEAWLFDYNLVSFELPGQPIPELLNAGREGFLCLFVGRIAGFLRESLIDLNGLDSAAVATQRPSEDPAEGAAPASPLNQHQRRNRIMEFLKRRLRIIRQIVEIYDALPVYDDQLQKQVKRYQSLLQQRVALINLQEGHCQDINKTLREESSFVFRIFTDQAEDSIAEMVLRINALKRIKEAYNELLAVTMDQPISALQQIATGYRGPISEMMREMQLLSEGPEDYAERAIAPTVNVEMLQGAVYRPFHQLSFGQKSGIILVLTLRLTEARTLVIDQPEDNLDTFSVINILAPMVQLLAPGRSIFIVTHSSHLAMALPHANLTVFETAGDSGSIIVRGSMAERKVVQQMLAVLEGGEAAFERKMKTYEDFAKALQKTSIVDMDLRSIESSFRRRTIDNLRNFLQPMISDRALLDFLRHQLKQSDTAGLSDALTQASERLTNTTPNSDLDVFSHVADVLARLETHIGNMNEAIDDIRAMDVEPEPHFFCIGTALQEELDSVRRILSPEDRVRLIFDPRLRGTIVFFDRAHFRLIIRNLLSNALRATEKVAIERFLLNEEDSYHRVIKFELLRRENSRAMIKVEDNGAGIDIYLQHKLYVERCSDRTGKDHGLGGIIIKKLLNLNGGAIIVVKTTSAWTEHGTIQHLSIPLGPVPQT
ncbi:ATP-binding protein [Thiohalocapsa sp. ML1]|jgi:predicted ATPase|uniref:sensor histidine kinase n=1 Tax=Thiohalocapsa sp. ML1 TaxID=1431688 RepID=UPI00138F96D4|nr:ATP-binding protein [Thiohalocapsa sp. ML1]